MGNRAIIRDLKGNEFYVHWSGGIKSVNAVVEYANLIHINKNDDYILNLMYIFKFAFGVGDSFKNVYQEDYELKKRASGLDNGIYILNDGMIVKHLCERHHVEDYNTLDLLKHIRDNMPKCWQVSDEIIESYYKNGFNKFDLKIGDKVYLYKNYLKEYELFEVVGFGQDLFVNGHHVKGLPYVNQFLNNGVYTENINNYIKQDDFIIKAI